MPPIGQPPFFVVEDFQAAGEPRQLAFFQQISRGRFVVPLEISLCRLNDDERPTWREQAGKLRKQGPAEVADAHDDFEDAGLQSAMLQIDFQRLDDHASCRGSLLGQGQTDGRNIGKVRIRRMENAIL